MPLTIRPLTPELWPALEDLFGAKGASNGCWCMYWRIGRAYAERPREENRRDFQRIVGEGPPPGLIAFDADLAVGWAQLTPRDDLPRLDRSRRLARVDATPVWSISCFYVRRKWRGRGVSAALIQAALAAASAAGASAVEAYPIDRSAPGATTNDFTGRASTFEKAGFLEVARRHPSRPVMRRELRAAG